MDYNIPLPNGYYWGESTFSPSNFPPQDNFPNSGSRTNYIPSSKSDYKFKYGFKTKENSKLYTLPAGKLEIISEPVFFTLDSKLYRGSELGISNKKNILSTVSTQGIDKQPEGFMIISSVFKPSPVPSSRLSNGKEAQDIVAKYFKIINPDIKCETNIIGSTLTDLKIHINNKVLNVEIKGSPNGMKSLHTLFDKSVRRNKTVSHYIECVAGGYCSIYNIEKRVTFIESLIDHFRAKDKTIGFAGDEGAAKSGKLPICLMTTDEYILSGIRECVLDHFAESGDHYFSIFDRAASTPHIFFVGDDAVDNIFDMPPLPDIIYGGLQTYGGMSAGATRIALKVKFKPHETR